MSQKAYRFRVYQHNSTGLSTGGGNLAWQTTMLAAAPTIKGSILRPLYGRSESQQWYVDLLDQASSITSHIADSSGRLDQLGRVCTVELSQDGGAYTPIGGARISDVILNPDVATWRFLVEDERRIERNTTIFNTTNTTRLYPGGPHNGYGGIPAPPKGSLQVVQRSSLNNKWAYVVFHQTDIRGIPSPGCKAIRDDTHPTAAISTSVVITSSGIVGPPPLLTSSQGNFSHVRLRVGTKDYGVVTFGDVKRRIGVSERHQPTADFAITSLDEFLPGGKPPACWVYASSSQLGTGNTYTSAFLHMMTAPPSEAIPLHIGNTATGANIVSLLASIYMGAYSTSGAPKLRYSTAALDVLAKTPRPAARWRITAPSLMADWLEKEIYQPFVIAPVIDAQGRLAPVSMKLPASTTAITGITITQANCVSHPTWLQPSADAATVLRISYLGEGTPTPRHAITDLNDTPADWLVTSPATQFFSHDRANKVGRKEIALDIGSIHGVQRPLSVPGPGGIVTVFTNDIVEYAAWLKRDFFDRFGDGPLRGEVTGLSALEALTPGQWTKLNINTWPNPQTRTRGGMRVVQIIRKDTAPAGPIIEFLDGGPDLGVLANPTLTLANSTVDPHYAVVATIGNVPAGGSVKLEAANAGSLPASSSPSWRSWADVASSGKVTISRRPSNTKVFARAAAAKPNRLRSPWVVSTGKTTTKITAPTALASTSVGPGSVTLVWTPGDVLAPTAFHLDTSTAAAFSTSNEVGRTPNVNQTRYTYTNLSAGTKYMVGVRHFDPYGGFSTGTKISVTTSTGAKPTLAKPIGLQILIGR